jgi:hypothetical protein
MMPAKLVGKIGGRETCLCLRDAGHAEVFNENMGSQEDQTAHGVMDPCVDQSDGAAVAVPHENRILDF